MEVKVPDIGDFSDVPVIEVLVAVGDEVSEEDPLVTLESEKASMDVPAPAPGTVEELLVDVGDTVSEGDTILRLSGSEDEGSEEEGGKPEDGDEEPGEEDGKPEDGDEEPGEEDSDEEEGADGKQAGDAEGAGEEGAGEREPAREDGSAADRSKSEPGRVVVIGSGPGGYTAAFRAADLGLDVVLVERYDSLGGVCLNVGCIPSKALLHAARVLAEADEAAGYGISFGDPDIDLGRLDEWKREVVSKLTEGLAGLAKRRKVKVVTGEATFTSPNEIEVDGTTIDFSHCIIAAGSRPVELPGFPDAEEIVDSTGALELEDVPERLLVVGGGIIGLEMATVYDALGSDVTVVEMTEQLIPGCDPDLVEVLHEHVEPHYEAILLGTKVNGVERTDKGLEVSFEGEGAPDPQIYDRILVAAGRRANGDILELGSSGVEVGEDGVIEVDEHQRTNVEHIHAIGDIAGGPMLAHKASHEGAVAAEVIAGIDVVNDARTIPAVAYTDPEVAWTGLTEGEAKDEGREVEVAKLPWQASGRALSLGRAEGFTKLLVDPGSRQVLGAGIVGLNAGELIAEAALAIEMGATAEDVALTIHPHPTLSETVTFAAEVAEGTVTDIYAPQRKG